MDEITREEARRVLNLPMQPNDADAETIRGYLVALVREVWRNGEGFSGKRPFGDSGWEWDMYPPLIKAGLVAGRLDEDGFIDREGWIDQINESHAEALITAAIDELGRA